MIAFHIIARAFKNPCVALSIAHSTGVTSIPENFSGTTHLAQGRLENFGKLDLFAKSSRVELDLTNFWDGDI